MDGFVFKVPPPLRPQIAWALLEKPNTLLRDRAMHLFLSSFYGRFITHLSRSSGSGWRYQAAERRIYAIGPVSEGPGQFRVVCCRKATYFVLGVTGENCCTRVV